MTYSISEEGNLLSDEMLQQIETMQGIENLRVTYSASPWPTMDVIYDENVFGKYIDSLDGVSGLDFSNAETRKNYAARNNGLISYVQYVQNGCVYFTAAGLQEYIAKCTHRAKPVERSATYRKPRSGRS